MKKPHDKEKLDTAVLAGLLVATSMLPTDPAPRRRPAVVEDRHSKKKLTKAKKKKKARAKTAKVSRRKNRRKK